ncbi:MAG: hypothetical protein AAB091_03910 [Elusimicrobiota bacterium]
MGLLSGSPFGGYIQVGGSAVYPLLLQPNSGNVGIGTTDPTATGRLAVVGGRTYASANNETYSLGLSYSAARFVAGQNYYIGATDSATPDLVFSEAGGTEKVRITSGGNVGIGTTAPISKLHVENGGISIASRTAVNDVNYTATLSDFYIGYTAFSAGRSVFLPAATTAGLGKIYIIKDETANAVGYLITIDPSGSETIDGAATITLGGVPYGFRMVFCTGSAWHVIGRD